MAGIIFYQPRLGEKKSKIMEEAFRSVELVIILWVYYGGHFAGGLIGMAMVGLQWRRY
jgi:hypothetical protein